MYSLPPLTAAPPQGRIYNMCVIWGCLHATRPGPESDAVYRDVPALSRTARMDRRGQKNTSGGLISQSPSGGFFML